MNHDRDPLDEAREWQMQERARREEREGLPASDDPLLASYRAVSHALRTPMPPALPEAFARDLAARCLQSREAPAADMRLEQALLRGLVAALALGAAAATAAYGRDWLHELATALPASPAGGALGWALALAACLALSWSMGLLRAPASAHR